MSFEESDGFKRKVGKHHGRTIKAKKLFDTRKEKVMPLHDFVCGKCLKRYEIIIPLKEMDKKVKCPHCKKELKKIMAPVFFSIK